MSVRIPPKTSKTVVFPLNTQSKTFETDFYDPGLMNDQVSLDELNQFIYEINGEYKQGLAKEQMKNGGLALSVVLIGILDVCIFLYHSKIDHLNNHLTVGEAIFLISFLLLFLSILCGCRLDETDYIAQMKGKCQDIVDRENEILRRKGLKWHLPDQFLAWIELTKDLEKKNNHVEIAARNTVIPQNTETTIIFPRQRYISEKQANEISRFSQDFYPFEMEGISSEEIQRVFSEINAYLRIQVKIFNKISFIGFFCLCCELFGLLYISNHFPDLLTTFQIILIAAISVFLSLVLSGYELEQQDKKRNTQIKIACQKIIDQENEILINRGLIWYLPHEFPDWIELSKELCSDNQESVTKFEDKRKAKNKNYYKRFQNTVETPLLEDDENSRNFLKFRSTTSILH